MHFKHLQFARGLFIIALSLMSLSLFAQTAPSDLNGQQLRTWLKTNYYSSKHNTLGYTSARRYLYNYIDNHNNKITCVYSGYEVSWTYGGTGTNPAPINCEHSIPQSYFNSNEPMKSDLHHLYPTYQNWNSTRSNHPFAEIDDNSTQKWMYLTQSQTSIPQNNIDLYSEYASSTFEPREDHKGNLARAIFYFYTMYPTEAGNMSQLGDINTFYQWHLDDPVDNTEINRNNKVEQYQGDRNPYIDYPELVARAWNMAPVANQKPATPANMQLSSSQTSISTSWNDVTLETGYYVYRSENSGSYIKLATLNQNVNSYQDLSTQKDIIYSYYVIAFNEFGNSNQTSVVNGSLASTGGTAGNASDLFISEYIEGSSYNKAIEIANFTGAAIDLSAYSLMKQTNGAGTWGSELKLSGQLEKNQVYIIAHSSAESTLQNKADISTGSAVMSFNGNDPIALFKNGNPIDIVGNFNSGSTDFAKDATLVRKSTIAAPNATYDTAEWDSYSQNTYTYIGTHTFDGGTVSDTEAPTVPTNLTAASVTENTLSLNWTASTDNIGVSSYDIFKNGSLIGNSVNTTLNISGLTPWTEYNFYVKAKDEAGNNSVASQILTIQTGDQTAPSVPSNLSATNITETSLNLNWSASNDNVAISSYDIYKNDVLEGNTSNTTYLITGLTAWTEYNFYIKAKDAAGNISDASTTITIKTKDNTAPSAPTNLSASNISTNGFTVNWNAATDNINVSAYEIYKDGIVEATVSATNYDFTGLNALTSYSIHIIAKDDAGNSSVASTALQVTTLEEITVTNPASDLFVSEYVEGSSYNKAIEIANFTGNTIDLANYSLKKQTNGAGTWNSELQLSGNLNHGEVYVLVNNQAESTFQAKANLVSSSALLSFNGNDPIALFKNGNLIDVIGNFNSGSSNFAKDATLVRIAEVNKPSVSYNTNEWTTFNSNTFNYLGTHNYNGNGTSQSCGIPSNLSASNINTTIAVLSWDSISEVTNYILEYKAYADASYTGITINTNNHNLTALQENTQYEFRVKSVCSFGESDFSAPVSFTTLNGTISYCESYGNNATEEWIDKISFNSETFTTGQEGGYADHTAKTFYATVGNSYALSVFPAWSGRAFNEGYAVWIDFNQNGSFDDANENILSYSKSRNTQINSSVFIPEDALTGNTRMRISMKYNGIPEPCETFSYGEVEDYTINIMPSSPVHVTNIKEHEVKPEVKLFPNPCKGLSELEIKTGIQTEVVIRVYSIIGQEISSKTITVDNIAKTTIDLSNQISGIYLIVVKTNNSNIVNRLIVD